MGILAQTCKKRGVKSRGKKVGNGKKPSGRFFLSNSRKICRHFCFFSLSKNNFLMSCLKVLTDLRNSVSAARLFHVFGPR